MAEGFLSGLLGSKEKRRGRSGLDDYVDLDSEDYGEEIGTGPADVYVKAAELKDLNDVADLKEAVYNGNILLVDISRVEDELTLERSVNELSKAVSDINGDIAAMGDDQVIVTPTAVKIDRDKLEPPR